VKEGTEAVLLSMVISAGLILCEREQVLDALLLWGNFGGFLALHLFPLFSAWTIAWYGKEPSRVFGGIPRP